jgi:hypothetical protein
MRVKNGAGVNYGDGERDDGGFFGSFDNALDI